MLECQCQCDISQACHQTIVIYVRKSFLCLQCFLLLCFTRLDDTHADARPASRHACESKHGPKEGKQLKQVLCQDKEAAYSFRSYNRLRDLMRI